MDSTSIIHYASTVIFVIACLVFGVNIIVEVIKKLFPNIPTTFLATVLSVVLTMVAFFAWASFAGFTVVWYYIVAVFILGLFVAYAAMFGFDKFKEAFERLKAYRK